MFPGKIKIFWMLMGCCGILLYTLMSATPGIAFEKMPVERPDLQAKLLKVVMKFSTRRLEHMTVGIIYVSEAERIARRVAEEFGKLTYNAKPVKVVFIESAQLGSFDDSINIFYVTPGNEFFLDTIFRIASEKKIFSCSGVPRYVRNEKIALGFAEYKGKPQIVLNLAVAKKTDHDFKNPKFLNLQVTRKLILIK